MLVNYTMHRKHEKHSMSHRTLYISQYIYIYRDFGKFVSSFISGNILHQFGRERRCVIILPMKGCRASLPKKGYCFVFHLTLMQRLGVLN